MVDYHHLRDSSRYQSTTKIGNWFEEREQRRSMLKDMLAKQSTGTLKLDSFHARMSVALQEVELSRAADDDNVHFGDVLQLVHLETGSVLACDVNEADTRPGELSCTATAAPQLTSPCARNSFVLVKYQPPPNSPLEPDYGDDALRYGQKVHLAANPASYGESLDAAGGPRPLCLFSKPITTTHFAKYCRNQLVGFTYRQSFDTVWEVVTPDPAQRKLSVGLEVLAGAPVLLIHCATQKPLLAEQQKYPNDFGMELELSARHAANSGMKSVCEQTTNGLLKGTLSKSQSSETHWAFVPGTKIVRLPAGRSTAASAEADAAVRRVADELISRQGSIQALERKLVTWSSSRMYMPADELLLLFRQVGLLAADQEADSLTLHFQVPAKPGLLDAASLLAALRAAADGKSLLAA